MSIGLQLILSTALVAAPAACVWTHPGANPYRADPARALADFDLPDATRRELRRMLAAHRPTDVATITRDAIVGAQGYADLRGMHSGHGKVCHGAVDRSGWSATHRERALVYCADDACVLVPTICHNVSLVTRKPEREVRDDEPIDIAPAAGPAPAPADTPIDAPPDATPPIAFFGPSEGGGPPDGGAGGPPGGGGPVDGFPGDGFPGGGTLCCDIGPIPPGGPGTPVTPPVAPVPETPTAWLLLAGLASLVALRARPGRAAGARAPATATRRRP